MFVDFVKLVELKLASGSVAHRLKDLGDVQEAIKVLKLPLDLSDKLDASVADVYRELWDGVQKGVDPPA